MPKNYKQNYLFRLSDSLVPYLMMHQANGSLLGKEGHQEARHCLVLELFIGRTVAKG